MNFTYETQGAITYLVCELDPSAQVDTLTLGMLTNNHIAGLAPVLYTEMNGQRFLKYNISAKVTANQFFMGTVNKQRALSAFQNILSAICSADDYMIDQNCFSVVAEHIFLNVSSCEVAMLCIPVIGDKDINSEVAEFFKKILDSTQFENSENDTYIAQLNTYINSDSYNVYGLKDVISKLQAGIPTGIQVSETPKEPVMQQSVNITPEQQVPASAPVSSFDSTITIDEMPAMMAQKQAQQAQSPVQNAQPNIPVAQPVSPVQPQAQPQVQPQAQPQVQAQAQPQVAPPVNVNPFNNSAPAQNNNAPQGNVNPQTPPVMQKPPVSNGPGFAIPGQPAAGAVKPQTPPVMQKPPVSNGHGFAIPGQPAAGAVKPQTPPIMQKPPVPNGPGFAIPGQPAAGAVNPQTPPANAQNQQINNGGKKMSLFGLLSHYNKENAELYKKQKEEEKAKKAANTAKQVQRPVQPPMGATPNGVPTQQPHFQRPPMGTPAQQQFTQPQVQPQVQPVPVQNSFNETTVLSPAMMGGETTVLSMNPMLPDPCLTRLKTGEKVSINKPVFRIGKEKSYVDYFIADNTAISRSHANIHIENGEYFIEDTNSTNHTYLNGKLINSNVKTKLTSGDKVKLANEDFIFSV